MFVRWSNSIVEGVSLSNDAVFEIGSMLMNTAFWFMKHAVVIAVKEKVEMDDAKEVHSCLRRAAGLVQFVQV